MSLRSRRDRLQLGGAFLIILAGSVFLYTQLFLHHSPVDTSFISHVHSMLVQRDSTLVLGDHNGLWRWQPADHTWKEYAAPLDHLMPFCLATLPHRVMLACTADPGTRVVSNPRGMWRSTDGGRRWHHIAVADLDIVAVATDHALPRVALVAAGPNGATGGLGAGGIYRTLDEGRTWHRIQRSLAEDSIQAMAVVGDPPVNIFVATADGLWEGKDNGRQWVRQPGAGGGTDLSLASSPVAGGTLYAGTDHGLWISRDAGRSWRPLVHGGAVTRVAPTSHLRDVYFVQNKQVRHVVAGHVTVGSGLPGGAPGDIAADPSDPSRAYIAYSFPLRVYATRDGGRTWSQIL